MGRGNRQKGGHWTDQHPDQKHWTPHQRALARMMTREAYEGLYGRGEVIREEEGFAPSRFVAAATPQVLEEIASGQWQAYQIWNMLDEAEVDVEKIKADDPFFEALWQSEWQALRDSLQKMDALGQELFLRDEPEIKDLWARTVAARFRVAVSGQYMGEAPFSLYEMVLSGEIAPQLGWSGEDGAFLRGEIIAAMSSWGDQDLEEFEDFARSTLLPALADSEEVFGKEALDGYPGSVVSVSFRTIGALFGEQYSRQIKEKITELGRSGLFYKGFGRADFYRNLLRRLARHSVSSQRLNSGVIAISDQKTEEVLVGAMYKGMGHLKASAEARENFIKSEIGQEVLEDLGISDGELEAVARGFDSGIYKKLLRGEIDVFGAWREAQRAAGRI